MTSFFSYAITHHFFYIIGGVFLIAVGIYYRRIGQRSAALKAICTMPVSAVCVETQRRGSYKYRRYNCTYSFEYGGRYITANNGIWGPIDIFSIPQSGSQVQLMIDPYDPENHIYDVIAVRSASNARISCILSIVIGVFIIAMPFLMSAGILS